MKGYERLLRALRSREARQQPIALVPYRGVSATERFNMITNVRRMGALIACLLTHLGDTWVWHAELPDTNHQRSNQFLCAARSFIKQFSPGGNTCLHSLYLVPRAYLHCPDPPALQKRSMNTMSLRLDILRKLSSTCLHVHDCFLPWLKFPLGLRHLGQHLIPAASRLPSPDAHRR